jgi:tetratricopeptide (TPR) repeat protein
MRSRRSAALTCALTILVGCVFSLPSNALPFFPQKSEAEVQDDIAFAKGLAKEWGFVDLAGEVIKAVENEGVSRRTREQLGVAKCEIYAQAAIAERDRLARNVLFEQAVLAYEEFLDENPNSESAAEAESRYISTCWAFARSLHLAMEEVVGEAAEALRVRRVEVLESAVKRTNSLVDELQSIRDATEMQKRERGSVMLMAGRMYMELGRSQAVGTASFALAHKILEDVVFDQGEGSPNALRAYDLIGQVYGAEGDWTNASYFFEAVIQQALPEEPEKWAEMIKELELGQSDKEQRWLFVELSTTGLCESMMAIGKVQAACKYALHLVNTQRREGFSFSTTLGYPALLSAAQTLLDSGGVIGGRFGEMKWYPTDQDAKDAGVNKRQRQSTTDLALRLAQQVVNENPTNVLQVYGQKLIADVTSRPGAVVDPSVLYEAAEGKYNSKEDAGALQSFKLVLSALQGQDRATQLEFAPKTFYRMGRSYQRLDQHLEACMAFKEGCTTWLGDPEYDAFNAQSFYKSAQVLQRNAPGDALIQALFEESERITVRVGDQNKDEILFNMAEKKRRIEKDYPGAIEKYKEIQKSSIHYEKAVVNIGVCTLRMGKNDEAYPIFDDYLEKYVTDDLNSTGGSPNKEAKRHDAMATAGFYRAFIDFGAGRYQVVIDNARNYYAEFPLQSSLAPWVMRLVGNSLIRTKQVKDAKDYLQTALGLFPDNKHVATFAIEFYRELKKQQEAASGEEATALLREMAELLEIGNQAASDLNYGNMRAESKHWYDLGEWEKSRALLEELIAKFGDDPEQALEMASYVRPDLAHVLLELHEVPAANAILSELVISLEKKPAKQVLLDYTRSVIGWIEGDAIDIQIVPGAGTTTEEFADATEKIGGMADGVDQKWACEWYALKFQLAYGYYCWATVEGGPKDSSKKASAKNQLDAIVQELGSQFKGLKGVPGVGEACDVDAERADSLGGDILRRRLVWLWDKVK